MGRMATQPECSSKAAVCQTEEDNSEKVEKTKKRHICDICGKGYTRKSGLKNHYAAHAGVKPFICEVCYKTFSKKCVLTIHSITHTGERPFVCNVCEKRFARKTDLSKHYLIHTGEKPYVCDECGKSFTHQNNLRKHKIIHTGEKPHVCEVCRQAFAHKIVLLNHLKMHYMKDVVSNKGHADKESFMIRNYLKTIIEKNFHPCDKCDKLFVRPDALVKHKLTHKNSEISHICEVCNANFKNKDMLQEHLLNHMSLTFNMDNATDYDDDEIDAVLSNTDAEQLLQQSEGNCSTEEQNKPPANQKSKVCHTCTVCFKSFSRRSLLKDHSLIHSKIKPHECKVCQKSFSQRITLKRHLLVHTGEKHHTCDICKKNFARKTSLRKHYITHSTNKLF